MRLAFLPPRSPRATLLVLVTALTLLVGACGTPAATKTSSAGGAATATASRPADPASPAVSATPGVPASFPVMPGSIAAEQLPADPGLLARWTTDANGADVYDHFVTALPAAGYRVDELLPGGAAAVIRLSSPAGAALELGLTANGTGTRIDLRIPDPET